MSVLIVHPSPPVVDGLSAAVEERLDVGKIIGATDVDQCLDLAAVHQPSAAVVDVAFAGEQENRVCRTLHQQLVAVIFVTRRDSPHLELLEAGAQGIVLAADGIDGVVTALETVLAGDPYVPPYLLGTVLRGLIEQGRKGAVGSGQVDRLSPREREVLGLLGAGADHREIAARLTISPHTAKTHINRLLGKLGVHSRTEAAALARAHGVTAQTDGVGR